MLCFAYAAHILAKLFCSKGKRTRTSSKLLSQNRVRVVVINNKRQSRDSHIALLCFSTNFFASTAFLFLIHRFSDLTQPQEMVLGQTNIVL